MGNVSGSGDKRRPRSRLPPAERPRGPPSRGGPPPPPRAEWQPGEYRVVGPEALIVEATQEIGAPPFVAQLPAGSVFVLREAVRRADLRRLRGRIGDPVEGWVSLDRLDVTDAEGRGKAFAVPVDHTHGKVWPGTFNLSADSDALRPVEAEWGVEYDEDMEGDGRAMRKLIHVKSTVEGGPVYECLSSLGIGAQADVWKMRDARNGRILALKTFDKARLQAEQKENCLRNPAIWHEFQLLRRVGQHPAIVRCDGIVLESAFNYFVPMEYVPGVDLHQRLWGPRGHPCRCIPLVPRDVFRAIIDALGFCHQHSVAHRDLKPTNVMLWQQQPDGSRVHQKDGPVGVKVMDFGLGAEVPRRADGSPIHCRRPVGTTAWAAPEVLHIMRRLEREGGLGPGGRAGTRWQDEHGLGYLARPTDVWSVGVLLWELLTARPLFYRPHLPEHVNGRCVRQTQEADSVLKWRCLPKSLQKDMGYQKLWPRLPFEARILLQRILVKVPAQRLTTTEIAADPWVQQDDSVEPRARMIRRKSSLSTWPKAPGHLEGCSGTS